MIEITTLRWFVATASRSPVAWIVAVVAGVAWPLLSSLFTLGVTTSTRPPASALLEIGLLAGTLGAALATATLTHGSWWLRRTTPWRRFRLEFIGLAVASFLLIAIAWLPPIFLLSRTAPLPVVQLGTSALLVALRFAAIGVCVLAIPVGALARAAMIPLAVYALPNLLQGKGRLMECARQCFDLMGDLQFTWATESSGLRLVSYLAPIFGLCLLRMAEAVRRASQPCVTQS